MLIKVAPCLCSHPAEDGGGQSARGEGEGPPGERRLSAGGRRGRCGEGHPSTIYYTFKYAVTLTIYHLLYH